MQTTLPNYQKTFLATLVWIFITSTGFSSSYAERSSMHGSLLKTKMDSMFIQKKNINKSHKVSLYPDAAGKVLFFNVKGYEGRMYQLFLFDLDGNRIKQAEIKNKQTTVLTDISKGIYLFEVFSDDEKISNGQLIVR